MTIQTKPASQKYKDGWDRIFGKKPCHACNGTGKSNFAEDMQCEVCAHRPKETVQVCPDCGEPWTDHDVGRGVLICRKGV